MLTEDMIDDVANACDAVLARAATILAQPLSVDGAKKILSVIYAAESLRYALEPFVLPAVAAATTSQHSGQDAQAALGPDKAAPLSPGEREFLLSVLSLPASAMRGTVEELKDSAARLLASEVARLDLNASASTLKEAARRSS